MCRFYVVLTLLFAATPLLGQYQEGPRPRKAPGEVNPSFLGEKVEPAKETVDAKQLLMAVEKKLGGRQAYEAMKDLKLRFKHKCYGDDQLNYIETGRMYAQWGDQFKARLDFDYPDQKDHETLLDYREVMGDDGIFKYLQGRIIQIPFAVNAAGERILRYSLYVLAPFMVDPDEANPRYVGEVAWKIASKEGESTVTCHKILVEIEWDEANIEGNVLALYIDKKTNDLRRMVFDLYTASDKAERTQVVDFGKRVSLAGLMLPQITEISVFWSRKPYSIRKLMLMDLEPNTGLKGVGFEMGDQEKKKRDQEKNEKAEAGNADKADKSQ